MTLDFLPRVVFASQIPREAGGGSSIWDKEGEGFGSGVHSPWGRDGVGVDRGRASDDIVKLLPADPFGMGLDSTWTAAIAGWIEDLSLSYMDGDADGDVIEEDDDFCISVDFEDSDCGWDECETSTELRHCSDALSCWMEEELPCPSGTSSCFEKFVPALEWSGILNPDLDGESWRLVDPQCSDWDLDGEISMLESDEFPQMSMVTGGITSDGYVGEKEGGCFEEFPPMSTVTGGITSDGYVGEKKGGCFERNSDARDFNLPPEGFVYVLQFLDVQSLLSVASVCKTLRSAVLSDSLLWRCIHVGPPFSSRLTDDALAKLTQLAQGDIRCLNLVDCSKITDAGLKHVLVSNQKITKLSVLRCKRLTIEGLLSSLKLSKTPGTPRMENLMIGGIYGVEQSHYEDLKQLLDLDNRKSLSRKPRFYRSASTNPSCDYDCILDIELCPRCNNLRLIYDCPSEACQSKTSEPCRACSFCIARCDNCGRCIEGDEYEETFYLDIICSYCMKHLIHSQEAHAYGPLPEKLMPSSHASES